MGLPNLLTITPLRFITTNVFNLNTSLRKKLLTSIKRVIYIVTNLPFDKCLEKNSSWVVL